MTALIAESRGILLKHAKNIKISGEGAEIVCRGKMIEVCVDSCENISIADLHFDYHRPTVSEFAVVDAGDGYADIRIHKDSEYKIENGLMIWYGEGWIYNTRLAQELDLERNDVQRLWDPLKGMNLEEIKPFLVRASGTNKMKTGRIYQLREIFRDYAAVFTKGSKNISWKDVNFLFMHGMGVVCQFSENLSFDSVAIVPTVKAAELLLHGLTVCIFQAAKGSCWLKTAFLKERTTMPSMFMEPTCRLWKNCNKQVKVRFMQKQTYGFMAFNQGDEIEFINNESYKSTGKNMVKEAILINPKEILLTLKKEFLLSLIQGMSWRMSPGLRKWKFGVAGYPGFLPVAFFYLHGEKFWSKETSF